MGESHGQDHGLAGDLNLVAHADDFQGLGKPFGHALDAVGQQRTAKTVLGPGDAGFVGGHFAHRATILRRNPNGVLPFLGERCVI